MSNLSTKRPEVYEEFLKRHFSCQLGEKNPFCRIPMDQAIYKTANKDTQTAGGTKRFSLRVRPGEVSRFYLTSEYRSMCLTKNMSILIKLLYHTMT